MLKDGRNPEKYSAKKIIEGQLPPDVPYDVFMTAKLLLQLPKTELQRITDALKERMRPRVIADNTGDVETGSK